jgi:Plavaka transposase
LFSVSRCTSSHTNLDNDPSSVLRTHAHTDALRRAFSDNVNYLWEGYGVVADVIVRFLWIGRYPLINLCNQPFTTHFPRADIHELLAPDLLHQIIKGTFKDHLVTWVMDYVAAEHGKKRANEILADIDRR